MQSIPYEVLTKQTIDSADDAFKLIIIGDPAVGKSCLLARVQDDSFKVDH